MQATTERYIIERIARWESDRPAAGGGGGGREHRLSLAADVHAHIMWLEDMTGQQPRERLLEPHHVEPLLDLAEALWAEHEKGAWLRTEAAVAALCLRAQLVACQRSDDPTSLTMDDAAQSLRAIADAQARPSRAAEPDDGATDWRTS